MAGKQKKRRWPDEEKRSICFQTTAPGVSVAQVARRYAMNANLIFKWLKRGGSVFLNKFCLFYKWISTPVMLRPGLAADD